MSNSVAFGRQLNNFRGRYYLDVVCMFSYNIWWVRYRCLYFVQQLSKLRDCGLEDKDSVTAVMWIFLLITTSVPVLVSTQPPMGMILIPQRA